MRESARPRSLYLHIPFCFHKCHYCDFYSVVDRRDRIADFGPRLADELRTSAEVVGELETIFAGGGTPTLLPVDGWRPILAALAAMPRRSDCEFTVEANPETVTAVLLDELVAGGVNRVSIGAQSFDPRHLATLERWHDPANVARAVRLARTAGIASVSVDLIFGVPGQTLDDWREDLERALALAPDHLSCYALTYEPTTALTARRDAGEIVPVTEDVDAAMFEETIARLGRAGFDAYEISNFARGRCHRSRHNLVYWENGDWWPVGPGASGHVAGVRWKNAPRLDEYLASRGLPPVVEIECADDDTRAGESFMMGLRLREGMVVERVEELLALGHRAATRRAAVARHRDAGLLEVRDGRLRLTEEGRRLANTVVIDLL